MKKKVMATFMCVLLSVSSFSTADEEYNECEVDDCMSQEQLYAALSEADTMLDDDSNVVILPPLEDDVEGFYIEDLTSEEVMVIKMQSRNRLYKDWQTVLATKSFNYINRNGVRLPPFRKNYRWIFNEGEADITYKGDDFYYTIHATGMKSGTMSYKINKPIRILTWLEDSRTIDFKMMVNHKSINPFVGTNKGDKQIVNGRMNLTAGAKKIVASIEVPTPGAIVTILGWTEDWSPIMKFEPLIKLKKLEHALLKKKGRLPEKWTFDENTSSYGDNIY